MECNNYEGGALAAEELIRCGCRNVLCIRGASDVSRPADLRRDGFLDTCYRNEGVQTHVYSCSQEHIADLRYTPELCACLDEFPDVDGVFATSDVIAAQLIGVLQNRGRRIPEDVKVIGYDDVFVSELTSPELTTIHQPLEDMAEACIDIIKKAADGEAFPARTVLHVKMVRRGTTNE